MEKKRIMSVLLILTLTISMSMGIFAEGEKDSYQLVILGTSDIHAYVMPYDYMKDRENPNLGLSKVYTLIEEIRGEFEHTLLFDAGDAIQGSLLGDFERNIEPLEDKDTHAVIAAMNAMKYDVATIGNHELTDYGLEFFELAKSKSDFPWISANIYDAKGEKLYFSPYEVIEREIEGKLLKVGVIGFTPPQIMNWGREKLEGKITTKNIMDDANRQIQELREKTDLIVVVAHTGISEDPKNTEQVGYFLSQIDGVDALLLGHQHGVFPNDFEEVEGVNLEKGLLNGVPTIMPGQWASNLGRIDLKIKYVDNEWQVVDGFATNIEVLESTASSEKIENAVMEKHEKVLDFIRQPVAENDGLLASYFSRVKDTSITQIINDAQIWFGEDYARNSDEYKEHKVLGAAAPFRFGRGGALDFTKIDSDIQVSHVNDIYMYPNRIRIVELNGEQVLEWLEFAAQNFNKVDPELEEDQYLINPEFPGFYWDILEGLEYKIDITKDFGERIVDVKYSGEDLNLEDMFLVVTNDHRAAGGGNFPNLDGSTVIHESTLTHQELIIDYIREYGISEKTDNWSILPFENKGRLLFNSSPEAIKYIETENIKNIKYLQTDEEGWGIYQYNFKSSSDKLSIKLGELKDGLDVAAFSDDDQLYLPLRFVVEKMGGEIRWEDPKAIYSLGDIQGIIIPGEQGSKLVEGRTFLPVNYMIDKLSLDIILENGVINISK